MLSKLCNQQHFPPRALLSLVWVLNFGNSTVEVPFLLGFGAAWLGEWFLTFWDSMTVSSSVVEMFGEEFFTIHLVMQCHIPKK